MFTFADRDCRFRVAVLVPVDAARRPEASRQHALQRLEVADVLLRHDAARTVS